MKSHVIDIHGSGVISERDGVSGYTLSNLEDME